MKKMIPLTNARAEQQLLAIAEAEKTIKSLEETGYFFRKPLAFISWFVGATAIYDDSFFAPTYEEVAGFIVSNRDVADFPGELPSQEPQTADSEKMVSFDWLRSIKGRKQSVTVDASIMFKNGQPVVEVFDVFTMSGSLKMEPPGADELLAMRLRAVATYAGCGLKPSTNQPADYEIS